MSKVLIWDADIPLANIGGPSGYLYNLHEYLKAFPNPAITFLSDMYPHKPNDYIEHPNPSWKKKWKDNPIRLKLRALLWDLYLSYHFTHTKLPSTLNLSDYDYIHFHNPHGVTCNKHLLHTYQGKIICTSHSPSLMTDELISNKGGIYKWLRPLILRQELRAYEETDYIMFPCKEAREPYEKDPSALQLFSKMEHKFFYCPSAILDIPVDSTKMQKFSSFGIPDDAFVITYFGRHNEVKGYDLLKKLAHNLLNKYDRLYFLCAGQGPINPPEHPRWIELGFINNTNELLSQSDLYVLPNRDTYFDLVVLEVLRAGVPIILSNTGGNKYFRRFLDEENGGIRLFDINDMDSLCCLVETMINEKQANIDLYKQKRRTNRAIFIHHFSMERYVRQYVDAIHNLSM